MKLLWRLAVRSLGRRPRRTTLTISAMSASVALLMLSLGLIDGMVRDMIENVTEMYHGHAAVTAKGYRDNRTIQLTLPEGSPPLSVLSDPEVKGWAGRVHGSALLSCGGGEAARTQPAQLMGIEPERERGVTRLEGTVIRGRFLSGTGTDEVLLGRGLAERIEAEVGSEIVMMGQAADGSIAAGLLRVAGILDTGDMIRDAGLAVAGRAKLQELFVLEGKVHEWTVSLRHVIGADGWTEGVKGRVKGAVIESWYELLPMMGQMLDLVVINHIILGVIFYFAAILVTANTMYMALLERMREFAIMGAIGLRPTRLALLIVLEGLLLGVIAAAIGGALGTVASFYLKANPIDLSSVLGQMSMAGTTLQPRLRSVPTLGNVLIPIAVMVVISFIVALWPARKLLKLRPVEVLREV